MGLLKLLGWLLLYELLRDNQIAAYDLLGLVAVMGLLVVYLLRKVAMF